MKTKFALCFGISIIVVGLFNLILELDETVLLGITLSSLIFTIINLFFTFINPKTDNVELLYIIPFFTLLIFCCFSNSLSSITLIHNIMNSKLINSLSFISFGLIFASEYFNYKKELKMSRNYCWKILSDELNYSELILTKALEFKNKITDESNREFLNSIEELFDEKFKKILIEIQLLKLNKENYSIIDFDTAYVENNDILKLEKNK